MHRNDIDINVSWIANRLTRRVNRVRFLHHTVKLNIKIKRFYECLEAIVMYMLNKHIIGVSIETSHEARVRCFTLTCGYFIHHSTNDVGLIDAGK